MALVSPSLKHFAPLLYFLYYGTLQIVQKSLSAHIIVYEIVLGLLL